MKAYILMMAIVLGSVWTSGVLAGDCCGRADCCKVCKLECTTKTIEKTCWGCECEDICIGGPSTLCKKHCQCVGDCNLLCKLRWNSWKPHCAELFHRKKLVKYQVTHEVPSYKWVVVNACQCPAGTPCAQLKPAPEGAQVGDEIPLSEEELLQVSSKPQRDLPSTDAAPSDGEQRNGRLKFTRP